MRKLLLTLFLAYGVENTGAAGAELVRVNGSLCSSEQILVRWSQGARIEGKAPASCSKALLQQALQLPAGVTLENNRCANLLQASANGTKIISASGLDFSTFQVVRLNGRLTTEKALELLSAHPLLAYAEPDGVGWGGGVVPNDPNFGLQWHHQAIDSTSAWTYGQGSTNVILAVLDTGLNTGLSEFAGRTVTGYDFVNDDTNPNDDQGHGTAVAGTAAATGNNATLVAGMTWSSRVMPVKVLNSDNFGYYSWWAAGIDYAVANGAKVINLSAGGNQSSSTLSQSVLNAIAADVIFVSITANGGTGTIQFPGRMPESITLGATDQNDNRWSSSNWGPEIDLVAPGVSIYTVNRNGSLGNWFGTSFAAPLVSGVACLVAAIDPGITQEEMAALLCASADDQVGGAQDTPGFDVYYGWGRLNAGAALIMAAESQEPPDFDLSWGASTGIFFPSLAKGILPQLGDEVLAQLYLAPDGQIDGDILPGGGTSGNDIILDNFVVRNNGGLLEEFGVFQKQYQAPFQDGILYAVIFSSDSPSGGDRYYRGPGITATNATLLTGLFDMNVGPESGNTWTGTVLTPDPYLSVRWFASWGFLDGVGVPILPNVGEEALVQIIYSPDGVADALLPDGIPDNDDVVIDARIVRNNGGQFEEYAFFGYFEYEGLFQSGFFYGVIYDSASPQGGDPFYAGPMATTVPSLRSAPVRIDYDFNTDLVNGNTWNGNVVLQPVMLIDWRGGAGFIDDQGNPILPNVGDEALVQLIYSPDGVADTILPGAEMADDDVVIDTAIVRNNGGLWEDYGVFNWIGYEGPYFPGFIYAVIYENTAPQAGARYYAGPMQATVETPPGIPAATLYEMNIDFVLGDAWNGTVLQSFMHFQMSATFGFVDALGNPILPGGGSQALIQLIYSPDAVADQVLSGGAPADNDVVLFSSTVQNSGGFREEYGFFGPHDVSSAFQAGYVYGVIYENGSPQSGDRYYAGPLQVTSSNTPSNPDTYEMNSSLVDGNTWNRTVAESGAMNISWFGSAGFVDDFADPILPVIGDEAAVQLIYSPDNNRDPILPGGVPGENDAVLATNTVRNNGGLDEDYAFFGTYAYSGSRQPGFIYGIIYEDADPDAGDQYFAGPLQAAPSGSGTELYNLNPVHTNVNAYNDAVLGQNAILDFDQDGLPNDFETRHFGSATIAVANVDSDFDGRLNLAEYIADTDPMNDASFFGIESMSRNESDVVVILRDTSVNRGYILEFKDGMSGSGDWSTADAAAAGTGGALPCIDLGGVTDSSRGYRGKVYIP